MPAPRKARVQAALACGALLLLTSCGLRVSPELRAQGVRGAVGGGQSVMRDYAAGVNYGASDPRKDGAAIPEPM